MNLLDRIPRGAFHDRASTRGGGRRVRAGPAHESRTDRPIEVRCPRRQLVDDEVRHLRQPESTVHITVVGRIAGDDMVLHLAPIYCFWS